MKTIPNQKRLSKDEPLSKLTANDLESFAQQPRDPKKWKSDLLDTLKSMEAEQRL